MKTIKSILTKYKYKVKYAPLHKTSIINQYKNKKDAVSNKKHYTIISPDGHVVGRLFHKSKINDRISVDEVDRVITFFSEYDIPGHKKIINELKEAFAF